MVKKIHQTWKDKDIPNDVYPVAWQDSWKNMSKSWDYQLWTDEDNERLVRDHYKDFWAGYKSIDRGVIKSDIARILILHKHGGIYADLDFICLKSFDKIIRPFGDQIILGAHKQEKAPIPNAWMYSPPEKSFWISVIADALIGWKSGERQPEKIAGPDRLHWALMAYMPEHVRLPYSYVYPHVWGCAESEKHSSESDWSSVKGLRKAYPQSFAVTSWQHNW
jgi:mannosyltransferase OCH1-like enzyme